MSPWLRPRRAGDFAIFQMVYQPELRGGTEHGRLGHPKNHDGPQVLGQSYPREVVKTERWS